LTKPKILFRKNALAYFGARRDDEEEKASMRLPPVAFGSE
jgi:hypothetical protein